MPATWRNRRASRSPRSSPSSTSSSNPPGSSERRDVVRPAGGPLRGGGSTSRGRRRSAPGRGRTAGRAARRSPGPGPRTPPGSGGRGRCRSSRLPRRGDSSTSKVPGARDLAELLLGLEQGFQDGGRLGRRGRGPRRARHGGPRGRRPGRAPRPPRGTRARSRASSAESPWRSLDQRGRFGSPPVGLRLHDQALQAAELQGTAVEHEAVAGLQPLGVGPFERADLASRRPRRGPTPRR